MKTLSGYEIVDAKARQDIAEHDTRITEVEKFFAAADSNGVIDKLVEVQKYIEDDTKAAADLIQSVADVDAKVDAIHIPTKVSELDNDSGYLTEHQSLDNYFTKAQTTSAINEAVGGIEIPEVDLTPYAKAADIPTVPTKVSAFENDKGYLTEHQSLSDYAKKSDIPDTSDFIKSIPSEYVTESELAGLATENYVAESIDTVKFCVLDIYNCQKVSDTHWWLTDNVNTQETKTLGDYFVA